MKTGIIKIIENFNKEIINVEKGRISTSHQIKHEAEYSLIQIDVVDTKENELKKNNDALFQNVYIIVADLKE